MSAQEAAPPEKEGGGPANRTADHQTDPHHHDQASANSTGAGGKGEHNGREQALRLYLDTCCGDSQGRLHVAFASTLTANAWRGSCW